MKSNGQIITESKLLEKMDELRRQNETLDWLLGRMNGLYEVIYTLETRDPQLADSLCKVYRLLDREAEETAVHMDHLSEQIERLYADLLVQEADANEFIPPALQIMLPPAIHHRMAILQK